MKAIANRADSALRIALKVPTTAFEQAWEAKNPGYELHAVESWASLEPGQKVWRAYNERPATFISFEKHDAWGFQVTEEDNDDRYTSLRKHSTPWDMKFSRVIVKV